MSVVMPHFNASGTLSRAIDSVVAQSWQVREIIVVDDASSDTERERLRRIVDSYPLARVIGLERNLGPAHARNVGWDVAVGEWVAFLDCDDAWHPKKIQTQLELARAAAHAPQMIAGQTVQVFKPEDLNSVFIDSSAPMRTVRKQDLLLRNQMSTPSVMVRRELELRFSAGRRFSEDYELWLTIAGLGHTILFVGAPVAAIFKAPYGESGLSSQIWPMITGEYQAYIGARRAGALSRLETGVGILVSTVRATVRLARLALRDLRRGER